MISHGHTPANVGMWSSTGFPSPDPGTTRTYAEDDDDRRWMMNEGEVRGYV